MTAPPPPLPHHVGRLLVAAALRAFPGAFRRSFGPGMLRDFDEPYRDAAQRGRWAALTAVVRTVLDLGASGIRERLAGYTGAAHPSPPGSRSRLMDVLRQDLRFATRSLLRRPGFTAVAVLTLAVGIGGTTAIFSVVNGVLLRPLPYPDTERIAMLWSHGTGDPDGEGYMSNPDIRSARELESLEAVEGVAGGDVTLSGPDEAVRVEGARVTESLLEVFGLAPALGRDICHDEAAADGPRVVMISWDLWQSRFGGAPSVLGRTMELSDRTYEIVGVAPRGFDFPGGAPGPGGLRGRDGHGDPRGRRGDPGAGSSGHPRGSGGSPDSRVGRGGLEARCPRGAGAGTGPFRRRRWPGGAPPRGPLMGSAPGDGLA